MWQKSKKVVLFKQQRIIIEILTPANNIHSNLNTSKVFISSSDNKKVFRIKADKMFSEIKQAAKNNGNSNCKE